MTDIVQAAQRQAERPSIAHVIERMKPEIAKALPRGLNADRVARLALTAVRRNAKLAECSPASFAGALLTAAALGLEPDVNGEAYLVPYKGECTLILGYQGIAKLFFQHPLAAGLDAQAVHANDDFHYSYGLTPTLAHRPADGDRGPITHYYAVARLSTGAVQFQVFTAAEIKTLRGGREGTRDIPDPQHWMERKTAIRQVLKLMPRSTAFNAALDVDGHGGGQLYADRAPDAIAATTAVGELEA